jgi:hypothetical protein
MKKSGDLTVRFRYAYCTDLVKLSPVTGRLAIVPDTFKKPKPTVSGPELSFDTIRIKPELSTTQKSRT